MRLFAITVMVAAVMAVAAGCGSPTDRTETRTVVGTLTIEANSGLFGTRTCGGTGGYSDIHSGAQATLTDADGTIVSTTRIGNGTHGETSYCLFPFEFPPIKVASDFYSVEISHRGRITRSAAELDTDGWSFELSLGL